MPEFRVGYLGRAGFGRAKFPWVQYQFSAAEQWGEGRLVEAWEDLSQGREGIILTVWDASRLLWFAHPVGMPARVKALLGSPQIKKWGYVMVDSSGVNPFRLPLEQQTVLEAFDRVLIASKWGYELAKESLPGQKDLDWIPHPINRKTFYPRDRSAVRSAWGLRSDTKIVGCVMTNQVRKHWPTVMEAIAMMPDTVLWVHTDLEMDVWNLPALALEYGIQDRIIMECQQMADSELALRYSTCDATVLISGGEGFGYPVAESLSCGVPVVSGSYGAQAELCHEHMLVPPEHFRIETNHNVRRAGYSAAQVADRLEHAIKAKREGDVDFTALVEHLDAPKLGVLWQKWARKGVAQ
jgi:glycosyltransferase involved in cell wall biosynthesis